MPRPSERLPTPHQRRPNRAPMARPSAAEGCYGGYVVTAGVVTAERSCRPSLRLPTCIGALIALRSRRHGRATSSHGATAVRLVALRGPVVMVVLCVIPLVLWAFAAPVGPRFSTSTLALTSAGVLCAFA